MKILITSDWYPGAINGVVASVMNLKSSLEMLGHDVRLLTVNTKNRSDLQQGTIYALGSVSIGRLYPNARAATHIFSHFVDELIEWHPDIIHSNCEFFTFSIALRIAKVCGCPLVHTYHTVYEDYTHYYCPSRTLGREIAREVTRHVAGRCDAMIAPTEKVRALLARYEIDAPVYTIPTGIRLERFRARPDEEWLADRRAEYGLAGKLVLLYLGRLADEKHIDRLIACMPRTPAETVLLIVGGGPAEEALRTQAAQSAAEGRIIFTGMVPPEETGSYYALGDIFVSASTSETQGLTYIEAAAAGLPLLCRADPCLAGVIEGGLNGNGVQWQDEEELLQDIRELSDGSVRARMSHASSEIAAHFSTEAFALNILAVYRELTAQPVRDKGRLMQLRGRTTELLERFYAFYGSPGQRGRLIRLWSRLREFAVGHSGEFDDSCALDSEADLPENAPAGTDTGSKEDAPADGNDSGSDAGR